MIAEILHEVDEQISLLSNLTIILNRAKGAVHQRQKLFDEFTNLSDYALETENMVQHYRIVQETLDLAFKGIGVQIF